MPLIFQKKKCFSGKPAPPPDEGAEGSATREAGRRRRYREESPPPAGSGVHAINRRHHRAKERGAGGGGTLREGGAVERADQKWVDWNARGVPGGLVLVPARSESFLRPHCPFFLHRSASRERWLGWALELTKRVRAGRTRLERIVRQRNGGARTASFCDGRAVRVGAPVATRLNVSASRGR